MSHSKILFDWGGTIARDADLFVEIARRSGNSKDGFESPDCWRRIRVVGAENYFDTIQERFFSLAKVYDSAPEVMCDLLRHAQTFVVYDNRPQIDRSEERVKLLLGKALTERRIKANTILIGADKLSICKNLGIGIAVEDDPRIALALASAGIYTVLVSRIWNRSFSLDNLNLYVPQDKKERIQENLTVAEDWFEISKKIKNRITEKQNGKVN